MKRYGRLHKLPTGGEYHSCFRHGHALAGKPSKEYICYHGMLARCYRPSASNYSRYGAKGIRVCARWKESFENFLADIGPAPTPKHSIQRLDSSGPYAPENCRWATPKTQARSRSTNRLVEYEGVALCVADWADLLGIPQRILGQRLQSGWPTHRSFTQPVRKAKNRLTITPQRVDRTFLFLGRSTKTANQEQGP